ncbi:hypothetical protein B0H16DRAFT_1543783 [Mycena metata]|uniref:Uncharacterized protein n=1 Tax=Mycena metata TaxID=1033252 RepID=A0AAD7NAK5_9AGAR|nr:hypothetical protein B0H16DRAFT_1543783 [Mycena metata]
MAMNLFSGKSVCFGSANENENDGPPHLRPVILKTVQNIYRVLAPTESPPAAEQHDLESWYHSAILSYRIDPVCIKLVVVEGNLDLPIVAVTPENRFRLVTGEAENVRDYMEDLFLSTRERIPTSISVDFQPIRDWVLADIKRSATSSLLFRKLAKNKRDTEMTISDDWQRKLNAFYERMGIAKPVYTGRTAREIQLQRYCPKCKYHPLQSCTICRIICCVKTGCEISERDGAKGCMKHPSTVHCGDCRVKLSINPPDVVECPECRDTYCREDFSWCIGRISPSTGAASHSTATTSPSPIRDHEPKPVLCPSQECFDSQYYPASRCGNPQCWSKADGAGIPVDLIPRAVCADCGSSNYGRWCAGKHLWLCDECSSEGSDLTAKFMRRCSECWRYSCDNCVEGDASASCADCGADYLDEHAEGCEACRTCQRSESGRNDGERNCAECGGQPEEDPEEDLEYLEKACTKCGLWVCGSCLTGRSGPDPENL